MNNELMQLEDFGTFKILEEGKKPGVGYTYVPLHMCFDDVKLDLKKARLVESD